MKRKAEGNKKQTEKGRKAKKLKHTKGKNG
jgi:hypothetical protein